MKNSEQDVIREQTTMPLQAIPECPPISKGQIDLDASTWSSLSYQGLKRSQYQGARSNNALRMGRDTNSIALESMVTGPKKPSRVASSQGTMPKWSNPYRSGACHHAMASMGI